VDAQTESAGYGGFVDKWSAARPEFAFARRFLRGADARARIAFACVAFELEHAAFAVGEPQVGLAKLAWWADELAQLARGTARHPLTQVLLEPGAVKVVPAELLHRLVRGAAAQHEANPQAPLDALLAGYAAFHAPLAELRGVWFADADADADATAAVIGRALRQTLRTGDAGAAGSHASPERPARRPIVADLPVHTTGGQLAVPVTRFSELVARGDALLGTARHRLDRFVRAGLVADVARARIAARARDPAAVLAGEYARLRPTVVWRIWNALRG
jgi:hypothetical protein